MAGERVRKVHDVRPDMARPNGSWTGYHNFLEENRRSPDLQNLKKNDTVIWYKRFGDHWVRYRCVVTKVLTGEVEVRVESRIPKAPRRVEPRKGELHVFLTDTGLHKKGAPEGILMPLAESDKLLKIMA
jgi:hypothetical protein